MPRTIQTGLMQPRPIPAFTTRAQMTRVKITRAKITRAKITRAKITRAKMTLACDSGRGDQRDGDPLTHRGGFTLLEVLLVLVILVVLAAAVAIPLSQTQVSALKKAARNDINGIDTHLGMFHLDANRYPNKLDELLNPPPGESAPYLSELPQDPWGNPYEYDAQGPRNKGIKPDVWSAGPDGNSGTEDDIGNWKEPAR